MKRLRMLATDCAALWVGVALLCGSLGGAAAEGKDVKGLAIRSADPSRYPEVALVVVNNQGGVEAERWGIARDQVDCQIGKRPAAIVAFSAESAGGNTLALAIVLDNSGSIDQAIRAGYPRLVMDIAGRLRQEDEVGVLLTGSRNPEFVPLTPVADLSEEMLNTIPVRGRTYLYDAVCAAGQRLSASPAKHHGIIIVSDGHDTRSRHGLQDALAALEQAQARVVVGEVGNRHGDVLGRLAGGGRLTSGENAASLGDALVDVVGPLPTRWLITVRGDPSIPKGMPQLVLNIAGEGYRAHLSRSVLIGEVTEKPPDQHGLRIGIALIVILALGVSAIVLVAIWVFRGRGAAR
jgi:hypothetical protein